MVPRITSPGQLPSLNKRIGTAPPCNECRNTAHNTHAGPCMSCSVGPLFSELHPMQQTKLCISDTCWSENGLFKFICCFKFISYICHGDVVYPQLTIAITLCYRWRAHTLSTGGVGSTNVVSKSVSQNTFVWQHRRQAITTSCGPNTKYFLRQAFIARFSAFSLRHSVASLL